MMSPTNEDSRMDGILNIMRDGQTEQQCGIVTKYEIINKYEGSNNEQHVIDEVSEILSSRCGVIFCPNQSRQIHFEVLSGFQPWRDYICNPSKRASALLQRSWRSSSVP